MFRKKGQAKVAQKKHNIKLFFNMVDVSEFKKSGKVQNKKKKNEKRSNMWSREFSGWEL